MIFHFTIVQVHFVFLLIAFHCTFPLLIECYHIMYIIIVFRLGSDKLVACFFYCLSPRDQSWDVTPHLGEAGWWSVIGSEKWENHKNSTDSKIKFYIIFMIFFYDRCLHFYKFGGIFFTLQYYFIYVIIKTYQQFFLLFTLYILHMVHIVFWCIFPFSRKMTPSAARNVSSPPVFDLDGWNKHHFIGNWITLTVTVLIFPLFHLFPGKTTQHITKQIYKNLQFAKQNF